MSVLPCPACGTATLVIELSDSRHAYCLRCQSAFAFTSVAGPGGGVVPGGAPGSPARPRQSL
jgi:hypothetical protein